MLQLLRGGCWACSRPGGGGSNTSRWQQYTEFCRMVWHVQYTLDSATWRCGCAKPAVESSPSEASAPFMPPGRLTALPAAPVWVGFFRRSVYQHAETVGRAPRPRGWPRHAHTPRARLHASIEGPRPPASSRSAAGLGCALARPALRSVARASALSRLQQRRAGSTATALWCGGASHPAALRRQAGSRCPQGAVSCISISVRASAHMHGNKPTQRAR